MAQVVVKSELTEAVHLSQRIRRARIDIINNQQLRWWSSFFHLGADVVIDSSHPVGAFIAATDYRNRYYNVDRLKSWTQPELVFLILHEIGHMLLRHQATYRPSAVAAIARDDKEFLRLGPLAIDYVVNSTIIDSPEFSAAKASGLISIPQSAWYRPEFAGMSWDSVLKKLKEDPSLSGSSNQEMDHHLVISVDPSSDEDAPETDTNFETRVSNEVRAAEAIRRSAGMGSSSTKRALLDANVKPLPWTTIFRNAFRALTAANAPHTTWSRPNRRAMARGDMLPGYARLAKLGPIVVVGDTSASIGHSELSDAAAQVGHIISQTPPSRLTVLWVDAAVKSAQVFEPKDYRDLRTKLRPVGGGGTNMRVAFDYIAEQGMNPMGVVVFTDGYTPFPMEELPYPVWWVITTRHIESPTGKTIHWVR